jgi:Zinc finger, C3HC4 type (RING finger)
MKRDLDLFGQYLCFFALDACFRRESFLVNKTLKYLGKTLADRGFFNVKCESGNLSTFKVVCVFCTYVYKNEHFDERFSSETCIVRHLTENPDCPTLSGNFSNSLGENIKYKSPQEALNISFPSQGSPNPMLLNPLLRNPIDRVKSFVCAVCLDKKAAVQLYKCRHACLCIPCCESLGQAYCVICRQKASAYGFIAFPNRR